MTKSIKNELAYFTTVVRNMDKKELVKETERKEKVQFVPLDHYINNNKLGYYQNHYELWILDIEDEKLLSALEQLSEQELLVLRMWAIDTYTYKEIATLMNLSHSAIKQKIKRIKEKILKNI